VPVNIANFLDKSKETAWATSPAKFIKIMAPSTCTAGTAQKKILHYAANRTRKSLYFLDWRIIEADFQFHR